MCASSVPLPDGEAATCVFHPSKDHNTYPSPAEERLRWKNLVYPSLSFLDSKISCHFNHLRKSAPNKHISVFEVNFAVDWHQQTGSFLRIPRQTNGSGIPSPTASQSLLAKIMARNTTFQGLSHQLFASLARLRLNECHESSVLESSLLGTWKELTSPEWHKTIVRIRNEFRRIWCH